MTAMGTSGVAMMNEYAWIGIGAPLRMGALVGYTVMPGCRERAGDAPGEVASSGRVTTAPPTLVGLTKPSVAMPCAFQAATIARATSLAATTGAIATIVEPEPLSVAPNAETRVELVGYNLSAEPGARSVIVKAGASGTGFVNGSPARTMRPVLDCLAIENHTITRLDEVEFIFDRSIRQAVATLGPVCFILSPLLTGGKVFAA